MVEEKELTFTLTKNMKYHNYLSDVVDFVQRSSDDFPEIQGILNRYNTLKNANQYLIQERQRNIAEIESRQVDYQQFVKQTSNAILNENNEIASLQKDLETCVFSATETQAKVETDVRARSDKTLELGQLFSSIDNILEQFNRNSSANSSSSTANYNKRNANKGSGASSSDSTTAGATTEAATAKTATNKNMRITESRAQEAIENLERIAEYIIDYKDIVASARASGIIKNVNRF